MSVNRVASYINISEHLEPLKDLIKTIADSNGGGSYSIEIKQPSRHIATVYFTVHGTKNNWIVF